MPTRAHDGDAGYDLYAVEAATIAPGDRAMVPTGIAIELPERHAGMVLPRSGLAARHGIALVNAPGLIDAGYRGEVRVLLLNTDRAAPFRVVQKPLLDAVVTALRGSAVFKALIARLYTTVVKTDQDYAGGTDAVDASE